jgi:hypothetical protein
MVDCPAEVEMDRSDVRASLKLHRDQLAQAEADVARLRALVESEIAWLQAMGEKVEELLPKRHAGQLTTLIHDVLTRPLTVREIADKVEQRGYIPSRPGRAFQKVIRAALYASDHFRYNAKEGTWRRKGG